MLMTVRNMTKIYDKRAVVEQLNLDIEQGQLIAYIGTNGAGKSTTMKLLMGLLKADSGTVTRAPRLKLGMVFQDSVLDHELTVQANLKSRAGLYHAVPFDWLDTIIEQLNLAPILKQEYGTLSGGQRRRVDIARALLNKPDILFLDEPTTGLDVQTRHSIWDLLYRLKSEESLTIFLTTHYLEEAENADLTCIIDHGRLIAQGSAQELKERYAPHQLVLTTSAPEVFSQLDYQYLDKNTLRFEVTVEQALAILSQYKSVIKEFTFKKGDMNDVFLRLTETETH